MDVKPFILAPGETLSIELYRCPNCSVAFGQERTVAGPKYCPAYLLKLIDQIWAKGGA